MTEEITFETLGDAIKFVDDKSEALRNQAKGFEIAFKELTGCMPAANVTALDVVKICHRLYGEPKH